MDRAVVPCFKQLMKPILPCHSTESTLAAGQPHFIELRGSVACRPLASCAIRPAAPTQCSRPIDVYHSGQTHLKCPFFKGFAHWEAET